MTAVSFDFDAFNTGTFEMELEEVGAYMRLLWYQAEKGPIPVDIDLIARILHVKKRKAEALWESIQYKFELFSDENASNTDKKLTRKRAKTRPKLDQKWAENSRLKREMSANTVKTRVSENFDADAKSIGAPTKKRKKSPKKNGCPTRATLAKKPYSNKFEEFWAAIGKVGVKRTAFFSWVEALYRHKERELNGDELIARIIARAKRYRSSPRWTQFKVHGATWLNNDRWEDDDDEWFDPDRIGRNEHAAPIPSRMLPRGHSDDGIYTRED